MHSCKHSTLLKGMCCDCGQILTDEEISMLTSKGVSMVHSFPDLVVNIDEAKKIGQKDTENLIRDQKLILVVDLDHTLVHACVSSNSACFPADGTAEVQEFEINGNNFSIAIRPGCRDFLEKLSSYYELHVFTLGTRDYAHKIINILDPKHHLIRERVRSRCDSTIPTMKIQEISKIFPTNDHMVVVMDDRRDVWSGMDNVIHVLPFIYFDTKEYEASSLFSKNFNFKTIRKIESYCSDTSYFDYLLENLVEFHSIFYEAHRVCDSIKADDKGIDPYLDDSNMPNMKNIISYTRSQILNNCRITFSGIIPAEGDITDNREYLIAIFLGAEVHDAVTSDITHLITNGVYTRKAKQIIQKSIPASIVTIDWLYCCYYLGRHVSENFFKFEFNLSQAEECSVEFEQDGTHDHCGQKRGGDCEVDTVVKKRPMVLEDYLDDEDLRLTLEELENETESPDDDKSSVSASQGSKNTHNEAKSIGNVDSQCLEEKNSSDSSSSVGPSNITEEELQKYVDQINSEVP